MKQQPADPHTLSPGEIVRSWRNRSLPKRQMIKALAELHAVPSETITAVLTAAGEKVPLPKEPPKEKQVRAKAAVWTSETVAQLRGLLVGGMSQSDAAKQMGLTPPQVANMVARLGGVRAILAQKTMDGDATK